MSSSPNTLIKFGWFTYDGDNGNWYPSSDHEKIEAMGRTDQSDVIYSHHMGDKFIRVTTTTGEAYVNTQAIASIHRSLHPDFDGSTQINMLTGMTYYSSDSMEQVLQRIVEMT